MKLVPAYYLPEEEFHRTVNYGGEAVTTYLRQRTLHAYRIMDGKEPLALMGLIPGSMVSRKALVWFGPFRGVEFTRARIREGKLLSEWFFSIVPYDLYAEVDSRNTTSVNFVKFFGMEKIVSRGYIDLYERVT